MARPVVSPTAERLYAQLPAIYRAGDPGNDWALLWLLGGALDTGIARVDELLERLLPLIPQQLGNPAGDEGGPLAGDGLAGQGLAGGPPDRSAVASTVQVDGVPALADPAAAEPGWLPWMGQFFGVRLAPTMDEPARRAAVAAGSTGYLAGTRGAIASAAQSALTGTKYVRVLPQRKAGVNEHVAGSRMDLLLITRPSETASPAAVVAAVRAAGAKGSGVIISVLAYIAPWSLINGTWASRNSLTWGELQERGAAG